jgi:hypothetical protein
MPPEGMGKARGNCGFLGVFTILSKDRIRMNSAHVVLVCAPAAAMV